jgi:hypothetical protein
MRRYVAWDDSVSTLVLSLSLFCWWWSLTRAVAPYRSSED